MFATHKYQVIIDLAETIWGILFTIWDYKSHIKYFILIILLITFKNVISKYCLQTIAMHCTIGHYNQ